MPWFTVDYTCTERTRQRVYIEAESESEARRVAEEYEFDNSQAFQVDSLEWSVSDVSVTPSIET